MKTYLPKKTKFKKVHTKRVSSGRKRSQPLIFGSFGLQATHAGRISPKQIEAGRRAIHRKIKELGGRTWVRLTADTALTKKSLGSRMGRGKGRVDSWVCKVRAGRILYEIDNVDTDVAMEVLKQGAGKLPVNVRIVKARQITTIN